MGERTSYGRSQDKLSDSPEFSALPGDVASQRPNTYRFGRPTKDNYPSDDSMPMFLSEYEEDEAGAESTYEEYWPARPRRTPLSTRILFAVVAAAGVAMLFALATSDATRDLIATAKASMIGAPVDPTAPPQPADTQLTARDLQLNEPARLPPVQATPTAAMQTASAVPTREDIASAYQSALQNRAAIEPVITPAPVPAPPAAAPVVTAPNSITAPGAATAIVTPGIVTPSVTAPMQSQQTKARRMEPDELAGIMKRAKGLLAAGDIPAARLLLERAADAQEAGAALMLAQTYDVKVLGTSDVRNINADPAAARTWYRRAAQLGSAEAQRRLDQLQN